MVLSCRGTSDCEFDVRLHPPNEEDFVYCVKFDSYETTSGEIQKFPKGVCLWIDEDIVERVETNEYFSHLSFVIFNNDPKKPMFMSQMIQ